MTNVKPTITDRETNDVEPLRESRTVGFGAESRGRTDLWWESRGRSPLAKRHSAKEVSDRAQANVGHRMCRVGFEPLP